jgi:hypothetical protein
MNGVTGLVGSAEDLELLATEVEHLRHEGQPVEAAARQRGKYLFLAPDYDQVAGTKSR